MEIRKVPLSSLSPAAYNPRRDLQPGDAAYEKLARSMEKFGCVEPVVWNQRTGHVVGGHQRLKVLAASGARELDVSVVDLSEEDEKALNLALNKIGGEWDGESLAALLQELSGSVNEALTGFDPGELDELLASLSGGAAGYVDSFFEDGEAPSAPPKPAPEPSVTVYGLSRERLEILTAFLDGNGFAYRLSADV